MFNRKWFARTNVKSSPRAARRGRYGLPLSGIEHCEERTLLSATLVKDINPGPDSSYIESAVVMNGTMYFAAGNAAGMELWKSDGTTAGTVMVKDIAVGYPNSIYSDLHVMDGNLYFMATDGISAFELWKSDGTGAGTVLVKDINPGPVNSNPSNFTVVGNTLYFTAKSGNGIDVIWKSDGTTAGTVEFQVNGAPISDVYEMEAYHGKLVYTVTKSTSAPNSAAERGLWITDGSSGGTVRLNTPDSSRTEFFRGFTEIGGSLYFTRRMNNGTEVLFKSDGTFSGTVQLSTFNVPQLELAVNLNGKLLYTSTEYGSSLVVSDGTTGGTFILSDLVSGLTGQKIGRPVMYNGLAYFESNGRLWKTDGTAAGTMIADPNLYIVQPNSSPSGAYYDMYVAGGKLYFIGADPVRGYELYRSNGTAAGTEIVADIDPGERSGASRILTDYNGSLFFNGGEWGTIGQELYKTPLVEAVVNNSAPLLNPAGTPMLDPVVEDTLAANIPGTLVSTLLSRMSPGGITDADPSTSLGIAVTGASQGSGNLQYSLDNGATWINFGTVNQTSALLLAADASTRVRYVPGANFAGTARMTFVAWDRFTGVEGSKVVATVRGGSTAFSQAAEDAFVTVTNTQDAPQILYTTAHSKFTEIPEDIPASSNIGTLISTFLSKMNGNTSGFIDPDPDSPQGIVLVNADQSNGIWQYTIDGGTAWTDIGNVREADALLLAANAQTRLRFLPRLNFSGQASVTLRAWDQFTGTQNTRIPVPTWTPISAFSSGLALGFINIYPTNDAPSDLSLSKTSVEEQLPAGTIVGVFSAIDIDTDVTPTFSYSLVSGEGSTDNSLFSVASSYLKTNAVFNKSVKSIYSIRVRVSDNRGGTFEKVLSIQITASVSKQATFGAFRSGDFFLDASRNRQWDGTANGDSWFGFAAATDVPIAGDWNGDGKTDIGIVRNGTFYLDGNGSRTWDGVAGGDYLFSFGNPTDKPLTGDWNGDGKTDIGIWRAGVFYLDYSGNRQWNGIAGGDVQFGFGSLDDIPVTGDWNGDGHFDIGVYRGGTYYLDANGNRTWNGPTNGDAQFGFAAATDIPVTGDWNGDGITDVGAFRNGTFYIDLNGNRKWDSIPGGDVIHGFAATTDIPLVGTWGPQNVNQSPPPATTQAAIVSTIAPSKKKDRQN